MDFVPLGNTTALGKRIESLAPAGSTAISASTAALVDGEFELRELGEFDVKGAGPSARVGARRSRAGATRLQAVAATRGLSRFVGRDAERAVLDAALEDALAGKGARSRSSAMPGVGKSRLVHEFVADCVARGLTVNSTAGVAHGRYVPFLPILALYRDYLGIGELDAPEIARERIAATMLALDPSFAEDLPLLFEFLGVATPSGRRPRSIRRGRQRRLLRLLTGARSGPQPQRGGGARRRGPALARRRERRVRRCARRRRSPARGRFWSARTGRSMTPPGPTMAPPRIDLEPARRRP